MNEDELRKLVQDSMDAEMATTLGIPTSAWKGSQSKPLTLESLQEMAATIRKKQMSPLASVTMILVHPSDVRFLKDQGIPIRIVRREKQRARMFIEHMELYATRRGTVPNRAIMIEGTGLPGLHKRPTLLLEVEHTPDSLILHARFGYKK